MRCYYLNFSIVSIIFRKLEEKKETHQFDYIIDIHNMAIHNRVYKNCETVNKAIFHSNLYIPRN